MTMFRKKYKYLGKNVVVEKPRIHDKNYDHISIGDNTIIRRDSRIQVYPNRSCENPQLSIGKDCKIGYHVTILAGASISIGANTYIGNNVIISSENHGIDPTDDKPYMDQDLSATEIHIGESVRIEDNACILAGVSIGDRATIIAGSVVTKDVSDHCVVMGNPAKVIGKIVG